MKLNEKQKELLKSIKVDRHEWCKDIIWLKRLDMVGYLNEQEDANVLFREVITKNKLYTEEFPFVKLISAVDNLWDSDDLEKRDWYEVRREE